MSQEIDLYTLIPEIYRREDARRGYPLKALLAIISEQANVIKDDIDRLWDNFFVETADEWVLPYIGDLVGNIPIHSVVRGQRADVARTISYRLRKGTLPMLEELARDVTGWSVHAVAFFELLCWTQNMNHLRPLVGTLNLCDIDHCDRVHTAFDTAGHTVDLRPFAPAAGWHHIPKVGFFIWRLGSYKLQAVQPRQSRDVAYGYHFHPLGIRQHLFHKPKTAHDDSRRTDEVQLAPTARPGELRCAIDTTRRADESQIAEPIRRIAFQRAPEQYFGADSSIDIELVGTNRTAADIVCTDLSTWRQCSDGKIGLDVVNGRFTLPADMSADDLLVSFHYGFSADVGGGSYDRRDDATVRDPVAWAARDPDRPAIVLNVCKQGQDLCTYTTLTAALEAWDPQAHPRLLLQIMDSQTYDESLVFNQNSTNLPNVQLIIQAANQQRPLLRGNVSVPETNNPAYLALKGLMIEGQVRLATPANAGLDVLEISHCTLVPGIRLDEDATPLQPDTPSIEIAANNDRLDIRIDHSISGSLRAPSDTRSLQIRDSIVDNIAGLPAIAGDATGLLPGPECTIETSTIMGPVAVRAIQLASNSIFTATVTAERQQIGCLRFSYVPPESVTPRRFRCEPDHALAAAVQPDMSAVEAEALRSATQRRVQPQFTTRRYGLPAYAQLSQDCVHEIRTGADNGAEMGVFNMLLQPQREANLRIRFEEYLPFGLEAGLILVN
ncbi:MAG: hypothetical protein EOM24_01800 [Chloroflexia bacterium]|nr:hypothetical protein [Chloroflexia bacterium]